MTESHAEPNGLIAHLPPGLLAIVGLVMTVGLANSLFTSRQSDAPWWATLLLLLIAVALLAIATALVIDPRPNTLRHALAGVALTWLVLCGFLVVLDVLSGQFDMDFWLTLLVIGAIGLGLLGMAATSTELVARGSLAIRPVQAAGIWAAAILGASAGAVILVDIALRLVATIGNGVDTTAVPWGAVAVVILLPAVTFVVAAIGTHRAAGGTFYAQAAANRRNSVLLLVTLIGVLAATAEIIAVSLTFDPIPGLWAAGFAALVGLGVAAGANRVGASMILQSAGARPADPVKDKELLDVVGELSVAANIPPPATFIIEDGSQNAFATGRDPEHAYLAVTRGLLERMDREELQGVIGHELGHVRNLDTRYALYVAILVGLVAIVTDSFLRIIVEGWKRGAFVWKGSGKSAAGALATGLLVGLFLLIVAVLLRALAPLFSALVEAATSREREYLADATSVEFTRDPRALERALASIAADTDTLEAANRGTQHLWFRNPVKAGSDRRSGFLATHPSLTARIDRLRTLEGLGPLDADAAAATSSET